MEANSISFQDLSLKKKKCYQSLGQIDALKMYTRQLSIQRAGGGWERFLLPDQPEDLPARATHPLLATGELRHVRLLRGLRCFQVWTELSSGANCTGPWPGTSVPHWVSLLP